MVNSTSATGHRRGGTSLEIVPGAMPDDHDSVEIVHPGATESAVGSRKASRPDEVGLNADAGAQAQNCAGILRDIRLIEGDAHGAARALQGRCGSLAPALVGILALRR